MSVQGQGADRSAQRYQVTPRTLVFITCGQEVLLLKGAPNKRLWPGKYNGIGGHIERGESIYAAAQREIQEETGITRLDTLSLRGTITIDTGIDSPGILLFVFRGATQQREVVASEEGALEWVCWQMIPIDQMLEDLPLLLPRVLTEHLEPPIFSAHYSYDAQDQLHITFDS